MPCMVGRLATPVVLLAALSLAGCQGTLGLEPALTAAAEPAAEEPADDETAEGKRLVGEPYKVNGRWFTPEEDEDYDATGLASWYGSEFHGSRTANGERFDPSMLTGAHPTLPLPSFVRVTNLKNGKAAVVRINDRGPFKRGRIVDVSRAVAEKLEFRRAGSAEVRVEYLGPAPLGGGDDETLVAEAKYGTTPGTKAATTAVASAGGGGIGRFLPFGRGGEAKEPEGGAVEVRLASAEPATGGDVLPGVSAPTAVVRAPQREPAPVASTAGTEGGEAETASAYQAPAEDDIDALIALTSEEAEPAATPEAAPRAAAEVATPAPLAAPAQPASPAEPARRVAAAEPELMRAAPPEAAEERILGAHELFGAIDASSGGAGELNGIKPAE